MNKRTINVTEPFLPPLEKYVEYLKKIWDRNHLTNQGPLVKELEIRIKNYHNLEMPVYCVANGALGLQIAIRALGVTGEVITTPFSYVATTACPLWEGCSVKFADIDQESLTISPAAVEASITSRSEAIVATHVFGNPCDVESLKVIAEKHGLALIYDAAHAFGITYKGRSLLEWGDASMVSMHATKLFHTVEGGFIVAREPLVSEKMEWMRRFAHEGPFAYKGIGTNAKMSELHAAMGLCNFNYIKYILERRAEICGWYDELLGHRDSNSKSCTLNYRAGSSRNYSYYPILLESETILKEKIEKLALEEIFPRRYFHPALDQIGLSTTQVDSCPIAKSISERILCLPLSDKLTNEEAVQICTVLKA